MPDDVRPFLIGFAAESDDLEANAAAKLRDKGLDLIVGNVVGGPFDAIGSDENKVTVFGAEGALTDWPMLPKRQVAERLWDLIGDRYRSARQPPPDEATPRRRRAAVRDRRPSTRTSSATRSSSAGSPATASASCRPWACSTTASSRSSRRARAETGCVVVSTLRQPARVHDARRGRSAASATTRATSPCSSTPSVDIAFLPEVGTLYPPDDTTRVTVEGLTRQLEGASRPGPPGRADDRDAEAHPSRRPGAPVPRPAPRPAGRDRAPHAARPVPQRRARHLPDRSRGRRPGRSRAPTPCSASRSATRPPASTTR